LSYLHEVSMTAADNLNSLMTSVNDSLIPAELARRPFRPPDYENENRVLTTLAQEMATNPRGMLQTCTSLVLELCHADSAGIILSLACSGRRSRGSARREHPTGGQPW
jgi:hypothetical protein